MNLSTPKCGNCLRSHPIYPHTRLIIGVNFRIDSNTEGIVPVVSEALGKYTSLTTDRFMESNWPVTPMASYDYPPSVNLIIMDLASTICSAAIDRHVYVYASRAFQLSMVYYPYMSYEVFPFHNILKTNMIATRKRFLENLSTIQVGEVADMVKFANDIIAAAKSIMDRVTLQCDRKMFADVFYAILDLMEEKNRTPFLVNFMEVIEKQEDYVAASNRIEYFLQQAANDEAYVAALQRGANPGLGDVDIGYFNPDQNGDLGNIYRRRVLKDPPFLFSESLIHKVVNHNECYCRGPTNY